MGLGHLENGGGYSSVLRVRATWPNFSCHTACHAGQVACRPVSACPVLCGVVTHCVVTSCHVCVAVLMVPQQGAALEPPVLCGIWHFRSLSHLAQPCTLLQVLAPVRDLCQQPACALLFFLDNLGYIQNRRKLSKADWVFVSLSPDISSH